MRQHVLFACIVLTRVGSRLKKDVEASLPDKVERVLKCQMSGLQTMLYRQMEESKYVDYWIVIFLVSNAMFPQPFGRYERRQGAPSGVSEPDYAAEETLQPPVSL